MLECAVGVFAVPVYIDSCQNSFKPAGSDFWLQSQDFLTKCFKYIVSEVYILHQALQFVPKVKKTVSLTHARQHENIGFSSVDYNQNLNFWAETY